MALSHVLNLDKCPSLLETSLFCWFVGKRRGRSVWIFWATSFHPERRMKSGRWVKSNRLSSTAQSIWRRFCSRREGSRQRELSWQAWCAFRNYLSSIWRFQSRLRLLSNFPAYFCFMRPAKYYLALCQDGGSRTSAGLSVCRVAADRFKLLFLY